MPRLSRMTLDRLDPAVARPGYARDEQAIGIVHLGIGAFHRAHQAAYTDAAMAAGDRDWAIAGVSLRSAGVRDALVPQDSLYTLTERGAQAPRVALIGAIRDVIVAPEAPAAVTALIAAPATRIVTLTVTEKAYFGRPDGSLDIAAVQAAGQTIFHHLAAGIAQRRASGAPGLTIVSCDNLAHNGALLHRRLAAWLDRVDNATRDWFERECACPATMVDRIVPAVDAATRDDVAAAIGVYDAAAIVTEPFHQWVIEDRFAGARPRWEVAGAQFVGDVAAFERAKLRMLNGAHSALAYLGLLAGHTFVHEAVADTAIAPVVERLMRQEAAASLATERGSGGGIDARDYADRLLQRFRNPGLPHRLSQIATDGSQKIPQRWLEPMAANARAGRSSPATLRALAAWLLHIRGDGAPVSDPLAAPLAALWAQAGSTGIAEALFAEGGLLAGQWHPNATDLALLRQEMSDLDAPPPVRHHDG
ncbi:mannitol dehydrogenase family protein [Sphingomonas sp.]|jgi:fructuronate reductase|uniref:mannitol dehydrogenase family protein n=1 Tax=Sphingomonas sp. TaxID=28214 RepID=UPI0035C867FE